MIFLFYRDKGLWFWFLKEIKKEFVCFWGDVFILGWGWSDSELRNGEINDFWDDYIFYVLMDIWFLLNCFIFYVYIIVVLFLGIVFVFSVWKNERGKD